MHFRDAFAFLVSNPIAVNKAKVNINFMTRQVYLPTLMMTDKGIVFVFQVIHQVAEILGINLKCAKTKHAQTKGSKNGPTPQSRLLLKWHQAIIRNNGTSNYLLQP